MIDALILAEVQHYLTDYRPNLELEFPRAKHYIKTDQFLTLLMKHLGSDAGLPTPTGDVKLSVLRAVHKNLRDSFAQVQGYSNHFIYDGVCYLLKDFRE